MRRLGDVEHRNSRYIRSAVRKGSVVSPYNIRVETGSANVFSDFVYDEYIEFVEMEFRRKAFRLTE